MSDKDSPTGTQAPKTAEANKPSEEPAQNPPKITKAEEPADTKAQSTSGTGTAKAVIDAKTQSNPAQKKSDKPSETTARSTNGSLLFATPDDPPLQPYARTGSSEEKVPQDKMLRAMLFATCMIILLAGIKAASSLLTPILLGVFLAVISWPLVALVRRTRLPDSIGIVLVLTVIIAFFVGVSAAVVASATSFINNSQQYSNALTERFGGGINVLSDWLSGLGYSLDVQELQTLLNPGVVFGQLSSILSGVGTAVSSFFYVLVLLSFIIVEISILPKKLEAITTSDKNMRRFGDMIDKVQTYILVKTGISVATAGITGIATFAVGVPYAGLWMLLTFVLNYVPAFGSILAAIPPVLLAYLLVSWPAALIVAGVYLAANFLMDNMLEPRLMGRTLGLSPLVVFVSLVFWGWLLGPIGMPLSTPLTMVVKIMVSGSKDFGWVAIMLGNGEETPVDHDQLQERIPALRYVSMTVDTDALRNLSAATEAYPLDLSPTNGIEAPTIPSDEDRQAKWGQPHDEHDA